MAEYSTEVSTTPQVSYLTTDHLGSPRVITDQDGNITSRKDYTAFGEENISAARVSGLGYSGSGEETRKGYTGYEKDGESGLDFAQARYYNSTHGRFTSVDPLTASMDTKNPQTLNRYSYVLNSPYKYNDPLGLLPMSAGTWGGCDAEFSSCDIGSNTPDHISELEQQHEDRVRNSIDRNRAQAAANRGDHAGMWKIIRANPTLSAHQNGEVMRDPNEPTVEVEATVTPPLDDSIPRNENVGITIVVWDNVVGISTRVLGHVSYIIDDTSYSFDASGYHPQTIGEYLNESLKISGATFYILDFGSKALNDKFKDLIKNEYQGAASWYTGANNCSTGFGRSIYAMRKDLGTWTIRNTPAGVKKFITGSLSNYLTGQYRLEQRSP